MTDREQYIRVEPCTKTGVAVWCNGSILYPLCGNEECLSETDNWTVLYPSNSWECSRCTRQHPLVPQDAPDEATTNHPLTAQATVALWLGVPEECVDIQVVF